MFTTYILRYSIVRCKKKLLYERGWSHLTHVCPFILDLINYNQTLHDYNTYYSNFSSSLDLSSLMWTKFLQLLSNFCFFISQKLHYWGTRGTTSLLHIRKSNQNRQQDFHPSSHSLHLIVSLVTLNLPPLKIMQFLWTQIAHTVATHAKCLMPFFFLPLNLEPCCIKWSTTELLCTSDTPNQLLTLV